MPGGVRTSFLLLGTDSGLGTVLGAHGPSPTCSRMTVRLSSDEIVFKSGPFIMYKTVSKQC